MTHEEYKVAKRERSRRLRELAQQLPAEEYWIAMRRIIQEPLRVGDNSYPENS